MQDQHIVSAFDRDLESVQAQIMKMGGMSKMPFALPHNRLKPATKSWPIRSAAGTRRLTRSKS